jgi:hypothetical protein
MHRAVVPPSFAASIRTAALATLAALAPGEAAADPASELATRLAAVQQGTSFVRLRLAVEDPAAKEASTLQLQIKERRTPDSAEVLYQVLWPSDRKGESVLLKREGKAAPSGHQFTVPDNLVALGTADLDGQLFGSDLAYADLIEEFFTWEGQSLIGRETVDGVDCAVLESKPGRSQSSVYGGVRSWIDEAKLVPMRVEKFDRDGRLVRRIVTTRVHKNDRDHHVPATIVVTRPGATTSTTELEGSRNKVDVKYDDETFTVPKMTDLAPPRP